jgi:hypothetical protein
MHAAPTERFRTWYQLLSRSSGEIIALQYILNLPGSQAEMAGSLVPGWKKDAMLFEQCKIMIWVGRGRTEPRGTERTGGDASL